MTFPHDEIEAIDAGDPVAHPHYPVRPPRAAKSTYVNYEEEVDPFDSKNAKRAANLWSPEP